MKVAFATPELQTLVRRTNLAEISEFLPRTLAQLGHEVVVFLPHHVDVDSALLLDLQEVGTLALPDGEETAEVVLHRGTLADIPVVLVDHPLFHRRHPYGNTEGPYPDNWRRYSLFARAVLEGIARLGFAADIIHCFDWTTGLIPVLFDLEYRSRPDYPAARAGTYFGVHNLAMQGSFEREILTKVGLPHRLFQAVGGLELGGKVNYLKAGIEFATIIGMHSPSQAERVQVQDRGDGLEDSFRRRRKELVGVLNGIDYRAWDPSNDPLLAQSYSAADKDPSLGKRKCKQTLQSGLSLEPKPKDPLITIIGRFDSDNGFEILAEALTPILERNVQLVLMGPGQPEILERVRTVEQTFGGRCRVIEGYDVNTAHTLLGGADILLLPNHFHSSNALCAIAMRYGVAPLVYAGSGLEDTVRDVIAHPKEGTGFLFPGYNADSLLDVIDAARALYKKPGPWKELVQRCLAQDFSWQESGRNYQKAYRRVIRRVRGK